MTVAAAASPIGWRLIRVTGLFLAILLPVHVAVVVVRDDPGRTTFLTVMDRLSGPWWPALEWVTLVLALVHGHLVAQAAWGRVAPPGWRRTVAVAATGGLAGVLGLGVTWAVLTFA